MKKILLVFLSIYTLYVKDQDGPGFQPYFSAVVAKDLNASTKWYQSVFGLTVKNEMMDPNQTYKIHILESSNYMLEILELKGSLVKNDLLKGKPEGTELQGHSKIGFKISNSDEWLTHLRKLKIDVPHVWTDQKTGKKNFIVQDPDGNLVQFFE